MDNWFSSVNLSDRLEASQTSMVGTVRSSRRDIPRAAKSVQGRAKKDSWHYLTGNKVLCSYWDKAKAPVLLLSTKHSYGRHAAVLKTEIVDCYNTTKSGADNLDKLVRTFRSQRKCRRWPYSIFITLAGVAVIAAMKARDASDQYPFKRDLGYDLALPLVRQRSQQRHLTRAIKMAVRLVGVEAVPEDNHGANADQHARQRCEICRDAGVKDRKTRFKCAECARAICLGHAETVHYCPDCRRLLLN